jgi:hypothetical protein
MNRTATICVAMLGVALSTPTTSSAAPGQLPVSAGSTWYLAGGFEVSGVDALVTSGMPVSYVDLFGPMPVYVIHTSHKRRRSRLIRRQGEPLARNRARPLTEEGEEVEEVQEVVLCQGRIEFRLRTRAYIRQNESQIVYVEIIDGAPESIRSIAVTPATDWNIKENRCNINYARNGNNCSNLMVEFTQVPNGRHQGTVTLTLGGGGVLTYTRTLTD